jgi:hypothetical protein
MMKNMFQIKATLYPRKIVKRDADNGAVHSNFLLNTRPLSGPLSVHIS